MAHIRPYQETDYDAIIHIFRKTAASDLQLAGDPALHFASMIWARPYIRISREYCFVIDNGNGTAVGYLLGVKDTREFVERYRCEYLPWLKSEGLLKETGGGGGGEGLDEDGEMSIHRVMQSIIHQPELMLNARFPDLLREYPAHIHIDILDDWQRQGFGRRLIDILCTKLRDEGVPGVHLGMVGTNDGAVRFYAKLGFERFNSVMDGGVSGETGRAKDGGLWLVKKLKGT